MTTKGAMALRAAVIRQAVLDYHTARRIRDKEKKLDVSKTCSANYNYFRVPEKAIAEIEAFFEDERFNIVYWDIDFSGAEFLEKIRDKAVWKRVKQASKLMEKEIKKARRAKE